MRAFWRYLRAQARRTARLYPAIFAFTAVLAAALAVLAAGAFGSHADAEEKQPIKVGLVGDLSESYLGIGVFAVQNFDSSKYYVDFVELDEETAKAQVKSDDIIGYVHIPDGFIASLGRGETKKITYVAGNSPASLGPMLMQEVAQVVSDLMTESQGGIYGFIDAASEAGLDRADRAPLVQKINLDYIAQVLARETTYDVTLVGVSRGLPYAAYYFCAFFLLMLLLCGTVCAHLLIKTDLSLPRLLYSRGGGAVGQVMAEYLPFAVMLCVNVLLLLTAVGGILPYTGLELLPYMDDVGDWVLLGVRLFPAVCLLAAMQFFVYELCRHLISGVLAQVLTTVALAYVSGFFYPLNSLPPSVQALSALLPTGAAFSYVAGAATDAGGGLWVTLGYTAVLLAAAMAVRRLRLRGVADA